MSRESIQQMLKELDVQDIQVLWQRFVDQPSAGLKLLILLKMEAFLCEHGETEQLPTLALMRQERDG